MVSGLGIDLALFFCRLSLWQECPWIERFIHETVIIHGWAQTAFCDCVREWNCPLSSASAWRTLAAFMIFRLQIQISLREGCKKILVKDRCVKLWQKSFTCEQACACAVWPRALLLSGHFTKSFSSPGPLLVLAGPGNEVVHNACSFRRLEFLPLKLRLYTLNTWFITCVLVFSPLYFSQHKACNIESELAHQLKFNFEFEQTLQHWGRTPITGSDVKPSTLLTLCVSAVDADFSFLFSVTLMQRLNKVQQRGVSVDGEKRFFVSEPASALYRMRAMMSALLLMTSNFL